MDAAELLNWVSFFALDDPDFKEKIEIKIEQEKDPDDQIDLLTTLFKAKKL